MEDLITREAQWGAKETWAVAGTAAASGGLSLGAPIYRAVRSGIDAIIGSSHHDMVVSRDSAAAAPLATVRDVQCAHSDYFHHLQNPALDEAAANILAAFGMDEEIKNC